MVIDLAADRRRLADRAQSRVRAYWTARGLDAQASGQPCGCDPAAAHICDRHFPDYEQFVFQGHEPDGWVVTPPLGV